MIIASQDKALLCPIRENYRERGEGLLEMLVTLGVKTSQLEKKAM